MLATSTGPPCQPRMSIPLVYGILTFEEEKSTPHHTYTYIPLLPISKSMRELSESPTRRNIFQLTVNKLQLTSHNMHNHVRQCKAGPLLNLAGVGQSGATEILDNRCLLTSK